MCRYRRCCLNNSCRSTPERRSVRPPAYRWRTHSFTNREFWRCQLSVCLCLSLTMSVTRQRTFVPVFVRYFQLPGLGKPAPFKYFHGKVRDGLDGFPGHKRKTPSHLLWMSARAPCQSGKNDQKGGGMIQNMQIQNIQLEPEAEVLARANTTARRLDWEKAFSRASRHLSWLGG